METELKKAIERAVKNEPLAKAMGMELVELGPGRSAVAMTYDPVKMDNIYGRAHGGAVFALIDEAFETASQTDGTVAVALNVNVTYVAAPGAGDRLRAEARMASRTRKTSLFDITVTDGDGALIARCAALAYRTGKSALVSLKKNEKE